MAWPKTDNSYRQKIAKTRLQKSQSGIYSSYGKSQENYHEIMKNQLSWIIGDNIKKAIKDIDSFLESRSGRLVVMTDTEEKSHWTVLSLATWQRYEFRQSCC